MSLQDGDLSLSVYNFQTKVSEVPMVRFSIFLKNINKNVVRKGLPARSP